MKKLTQRGTWQSLMGGLLAAASLFLLLPVFNEATRAAYTEQGGGLAQNMVQFAIGVAVLLSGAALLLIGFFVRRAYYKRPRTYANRSADHTSSAGERPVNPYQNPGQGYQTGVF